MGNTLTPEAMRAFRDELEKSANFRAGFSTLLGRLRHPVQGLKQGWNAMSPSGVLQGAAGAANQAALKKGILKTVGAHYTKGAVPFLRRQFGAGVHLAEGRKITGLQSAAEAASRAGFTGKSRVTKYLPVGSKGIQGMFVGGSAHSALKLSKKGKERQAGENLGQALGFAGTQVLTAGVPLGFAAPLLLEQGGSALGKKVGKTLGTQLHKYRTHSRRK